MGYNSDTDIIGA